MDFISILDRKSCTADFTAKDKNQALIDLAHLAVQSDLLKGTDPVVIAEKLAEREQQGSTGFGNEIAIPHARIPGLDRFLLFVARSRRGTFFDALDKKRVKLFFVILGPEESVNEHLQILAALSRSISQTNLKKEMIGSPTRPALVEAFLKNTRQIDRASGERQKMKLFHIILYLDEFLYHILELFIQEGIEGASIIDSAGMGEYVSNIPLFANFIGFMNASKNQSKTIMALVPEPQADDLVQKIEEITGDLDTKQGAMIFTTDVSFYKGTMKMM